MFERCRLICLSDASGKADWLAQGGESSLISSADQLRGMLLIGAPLPERVIFDGSLKAFIHLFPERTPEESCALANGYLEAGAAEWSGGGWEFFTCRTAVLGCCSGFYLAVVNKKELKA